MPDPNYDPNKNRSILQAPFVAVTDNSTSSSSAAAAISSSNNCSAGITRRFIPKIPDKTNRKFVEDDASSIVSSSGTSCFIITLILFYINLLNLLNNSR